MRRFYVDYRKFRDAIPEGAVALYRGDWGKWQHALIMAGTRSPYVHAGLLSWRTPPRTHLNKHGVLVNRYHREDRRLELVDTIQRIGARTVPFLSREVRKHPYCWDVFVVTDHAYKGKAATRDLRRRAAKKLKYGWRAFFAAARLHYPILRWFPPRDLTEDEDSLRIQMCSGAVSQAMRESGGVDPAPDLKDRYTAPGDLLRGGVLRYLCTPVWVPANVSVGRRPWAVGRDEKTDEVRLPECAEGCERAHTCLECDQWRGELPRGVSAEDAHEEECRAAAAAVKGVMDTLCGACGYGGDGAVERMDHVDRVAEMDALAARCGYPSTPLAEHNER